MRWRVKKLSWGNGGTVQIASWKCNFGIYLDIQVYYLDIQAITTLHAFYWLFMCWFLLFIHFSTLQPLSWKVTFSGTQKLTPPTVFNLQASDWVHCEKETGAYYQLSRLTYKFIIFDSIFKVAYFAKKKFQKIPKNLLFSFFSKRDNWAYVYMY